MVFDDEQTKRGADEPAPEDETGKEERRDRGSGRTVAAGAGGAGLGAGAAAGIVGGEEALEIVRDATGDGDEGAADEANLSELQERIEAAQAAAAAATRAASIDVFESQAEDAASAVPNEIAAAAGIIGDALPPLPSVDDPAPTAPGGPPGGERPQPEDLVPSGEDAPSPGGPPSIGRPQTGDETETEAPESTGAESEDDAPAPPAPPGAPSGPDAPDAPAPPAFPSPPSGGPPPAPAPSAESGADDDAVVAEAPAPPAPAPGAGESDDVVAEAPAVDDASSPSIPDAPGQDAAPPVSSEPAAPGTSDDDSPAPPAPGSSDESDPPVSSEPSAPDPGSSSGAPEPPVASEPETPSAPPAPGGSDSSSSGSGESTPPPPGSGGPTPPPGSGAPTPPSSGGPDTGPPSAPPSGPDAGPSPGGEPGASYNYPYVYEWDDEGHWVDMALENDHGGVYYLRYYDDGSVYYLNEEDQYVQVQGDNLPHLLYVGDDGTAYFSKIQHHDTVYFSFDSYGNFDWVDYDEVPGYEAPPYEDEYEYPRLVDYEDGDGGWALIEMENGQLVKYYDEGGAYWVDEHGNEEAIADFQVPSLIYVDADNEYAYFRVFNETEGEYRYYYIDEDGGVEYVHDYDVPGYVPPIDDEYEYPRVLEWNADEGWVIVQGEEGEYAKYFLNGDEDPIDQYGNVIYNGGLPFAGDLLYFDEYGNAWFRGGEEGNYTYFMVDHDGGLEYVDYHDIPNYQDLEPPYGAHPPYFFEDYPNPFYGDLEPDGEPTFANGVYQQSYNDGQVVVTWFQEGGPYEVRYYSEDNAGGYLQLHLTYDAEAYDYNVHTYPYDYFDHVEEDFELEPIDHYVDFAYLGIPYDNMEISNDYVEYYWYDDDGEVLQKTQVNRHTGEVIYEYDELYIHVDRYGNEYYEGYPDPNWEPPAGYGEVEDYPPYGMPPYMVFGEDYDYEMQYADPDEAGYELISATPVDDPTQWQYIGPNGERVIVNKLDEYTYQFAYQPDPNATPGSWEMVMNVTTDEHGNYVSYEAVGGDYYDEYYQVEVEEGDYNPAWAEYYDSNYGFDHPYDLYGEPDPPGENQNPNVHVFGGGRAMVVRNEDGSETITWYSEGGYQDGYIEYKATVEYEGGQWVTESESLPLDLIPVYGLLPVEGTPIYDPYNANAPWGEPESVTILEDRVIAIWETDEGQIRSEWYRDGSHYREVRYPDGLVISWGGGGWEYDVPDDWTPPDYAADAANLYTEAAALEALPDGLPAEFADGYPNPEADGYHYSHSYDGGDQPVYVFHSNDGTQTIFVSPGADGVQLAWYEGQLHTAPGETETPPDYFQAVTTVDANGQYTMQYWDAEEGWVDTPPVDDVYEYEVDGYLPDGAPDYFGSPEWVNPETDARFEFWRTVGEQGATDGPAAVIGRVYRADLDGDGAYDYHITVNEHGDGEIEVRYQNLATGQHELTVHVEQDAYGNYVDDTPEAVYGVPDPQGVPPYEPDDAPEYDAQYVYDLLPDNLPEHFEGGYANPEYSSGYEYHHSAQYGDGMVHFFDYYGYATAAVVENPDGTHSMYWYDRPVDQFGPLDGTGAQAMALIYPNGQYNTQYYVDGEWVGTPPPPVDAEDAPDALLPDGTPAYFNNDPMWVNPEDDERFQEVQYNPNVEGTGTAYRAYRANLDDDPGSEYLINVWEHPDGSVRVEYYHLNELQATVNVIVQPDGSFGTSSVTYEVGDYYGVPAPGEYEAPEDEELDPWTAHLPTHWNMELETGQYTNFNNPEATTQVVDYTLVSESPTERIYEDQFGQYVKITNNGGGHFTFAWGDDLNNPELVMGVPSQGDPTVEQTSIGVVDPWAEEVDEVDDLEIEADGYLPNGAPVFFDSGLWPNPEMDNRFVHQYQSEPEPGVIARFYHADLDGNGAYDYRAVVMEYPDGTVYVDYGHLNGQGEARFILTQDANGNYVEHDAIYYVNDPVGAPFESAAAESPDEDGQPMDAAPSDAGDEPEAPGDEPGEAPDVPDDPDEGPPPPPPPPTPPSESESEEGAGAQQLQFASEEEGDADEEPLEFDGPETDGGDEAPEDAESESEAEEIEPVEIAEPEIVEAEAEDDSIAPPAADDDDMADNGLDDDEDDDGTGL